MELNNEHSDEAVLKELGERISQYRLNQNISQAMLAKEAGVSHRTLVRVEHGQSVQASSFIRILRALQLLANFDALLPEPVASPIQQLKVKGKQRQRASSKSTPSRNQKSWSWGDEE